MAELEPGIIETGGQFVISTASNCNCEQALSLVQQLEITATALHGIKDALGLPSTPEMRLDAIGTLIGLAEANLERLNRG